MIPAQRSPGRAGGPAKRLLDLLVAVVLVVLTLVFVPPRLGGALHWDEADDASAALYGWKANALDSGVVNVLRHYHPPGLQYLSLASMTVFGRTEAAFRLPTYVAAVAAPALVFVFLRAFGVAAIVAFAWSALLAVLPVTSAVALSARPNSLVGLGALAVAAFAARAVGSGRVRHLALCTLALAASALVMEYGILLLVLVIAGLIFLPNPWLAFDHRSLRMSWAFLACLAAGLVVFLGCWPAGLTRYPANFFYYATYAGRPVQWAGQGTSHPPRWAALWWMFEAMPWAAVVVVGGLVASLAALARQVRPDIRMACLVALGLFAAAFIQHQKAPSYAFYYLPAAIFVSVVVTNELGHRARQAVAALVLLAAVATGASSLAFTSTGSLADPADGIRELVGTVPPDGRVALEGHSMAFGPSFYLNGGFGRRGPETVEAVRVAEPRSPLKNVFWRAGDAEISIEVEPTLLSLVRGLGHGGSKILTTGEGDARAAFDAEVKAGRWTHALLAVPWSPDHNWIAAPVVGHWREVKSIPVGPVGADRRLVLYAAPALNLQSRHD